MAYNFQKALDSGETEKSIRAFLRSKNREKEADAYFKPAAAEPEQKNTGPSLGSKLKERGKAIVENLKPGPSTGNAVTDTIRPAEKGLRAVGQAAGAVEDVIGAGISKIIPEDVKKRGAELLKTEVGQSAIAALSQGADVYKAWKAKHPELAKDVEAVVNIGAFMAEFAGGGIAKEAVESSAKKALTTTTRNVVQEAVPVVSRVATAPSVTERVVAGAKSIKDRIVSGVTKVKDEATKMADAELATKNLPKPEARLVKLNTDPTVIQRLKTSAPDDVRAAQEMLTRQVRNTALERGVPAAKEVPGQTILEFPKYAIQARRDIGKALGETVDVLPNKPLDILPQVNQVVELLRSKGIQITKGGKLVGDTVVQGDIPIYQRMYDLIRPQAGVARATPKRLHEIRQVIFKEFNLAKSRTQPFSDEAMKVAEEFRRIVGAPINALTDDYAKLSKAYAELSNPLEEFVRLMGHKGDLDEISEKTLRAGEIAQRILGNAADRPLSIISDLETIIKKYGFKSKGNWQDQVWLSDLIEDVVGSTQVRSLTGGVKRGVTSAIENALGQATQSGNIIGAGIGLVRGAVEPTRDEIIAALKEYFEYLSKGVK